MKMFKEAVATLAAGGLLGALVGLMIATQSWFALAIVFVFFVLPSAPRSDDGTKPSPPAAA